MINELKTFFNNINIFRNLLTEGVSDNVIVDAINNREYIYLYYDGDENNSKGYRTCRPFVLGVSGKGKKLLRAWQDKGNSDSYKWLPPARRRNHEFHIDVDGKEKPGWRLFRVDKISQIYPTGNRFMDSDGNVMIPPLYHKFRHANDKQMLGGTIVQIELPSKELQTKDLDVIGKPDVMKQKIDKSEIEPTKQGKYSQFYNIGSRKREATARDIENLYNFARKVYKKSPNRYLVAVDNKGNLQLVDIVNKDKISPEAIVGDLTALYSKLVLANKDTTQQEKDFFNKIKSDLDKKTK